MVDDYARFIDKIHTKIGIDLTLYKEKQMKRRLTSLRDKRGYQSFDAYFSAMEKDNVLLKEFAERITINVSEFFRNPKRWDVLQTKIVPMLTANTGNVTIWSAACSTGEEPYSLAILMKEYFPSINVKIIATDIDETVLAKAKEGIYSEKALKELPEKLKSKYFKVENGLYYLNQSIKQVITFKKHNLLADRYPENMDLIVCRNVLIYFTDQAKDKIYQYFSNALKMNGIFFVGSTEQIFSPQKYGLTLFDTFFYQKDH